jgi:predicted amidohydrolase YtcJ
VTADLILTGASIRTMNSANPVADAIAIRDNKVLAVGFNKEIAALKSRSTREIALEGQMVMPAFIEGHAHLMKLGQKYLCLDAGPARSWDEILDLVAEEVAKTPKGQWIYGRGWHQSRWTYLPPDAVEGLPTVTSLDKVAPDHPVILTHNSGHIMIVNSYAMREAGVGSDTPDPEGGDMIHFPDGKLTGVFREAAREAIYETWHKALATRPDHEIRAENDRKLDSAINVLHRSGIATFHDMMTTFDEYNFFLERVAEGNMGVRTLAFIHEEPEKLKEHLATVRYKGKSNWLHITALKGFMDGAFGSNTALMLAPYADKPDDVGLYYDTHAKIRATMDIALEQDLQMAIHAIGDRAVREVLDLYQEHQQDIGAARWRLEHAAAIDPADLPRFNELGVLAPVQGAFISSDANFLVDRLGEKRARETAYIFRTMMDLGIPLSNGTDAPIEDVDPLSCLYSTVARKRPGEECAFFEEQALSIQEALETYTINAAYSGKEERLKGSLETGKLADITVLSNDIIAEGVESIPDTRVDMTIIDGKVVYERA